MSRNSVKVCVRTRPTQYFAQDNIFIDTEHNTIQVTTGEKAEPGAILNNRQNSFKFRFDHVFHNSSQSDVYDLFARDIVQSVVDGINGCIMTYGQTGSGKTFTMMGDTQNYEHRGAASRSLSQIFGEVNSRVEFEYRVTATYMEIYNERVYDLLTDLSNPDQSRDYTIVEEQGGRGTFVRGLTEIEVTNENEALNLLFSGELARTTAQHKLNRKSNRSHSLFTVYLEQRQRSGVSERVIHSKLHLVDLAGSERLKKTLDAPESSHQKHDDQTKKESMCINQSLTYLEQCVVALARRGHSHVPYRQSKLTNILKDALGANCNTLMIACMWGEASHLEETTSTLRLASRMMRVQNETTMVETVDSAALIKKQTKLINALKQELLMHDALVERTGVHYEPYTPEQQTAISQMLDRYIDAKEADEEDLLNINSYRQMLEVCKQFKKIVLTTRAEVVSVRQEAMTAMSTRPLTTGGFGNATGDFSADSKIAEDYDPNAPTVGEKDKNRTGFGLGVASSDARPSTGIDGIPRTADAKGMGGSGTASGASIMKGKGASPTKSSKVDCSSSGTRGDMGTTQLEGQGALFDSFVRNNVEGKQLFTEFSEAKSNVKEVKTRIRDLTSAVNEAKGNIDTFQRDIEIRKQSRIEMLRKSGLKASETEDIVDEDEFKLMKDLREAKRSYKNGFEQLQKYKSTLSAFQINVDNCKAELNGRFAQWSNNNMEASLNETGPSGFDGGGTDDQLDDQEAFDRLEVQRVLANDPDSLAFFNAQKTRRANITQNSTNIRQMQKNKRFG